jgi:hypothetical protein
MAALCFFGNTFHTRSSGVGAEGHSFIALWIKHEVMKLGGVLVWNRRNGSVISHTTLYRNKISCSH